MEQNDSNKPVNPPNSGMTAQFDLNAWLTGLLFADTGGMQPGGAGCEVCQHLPGHGFERGVSGGTLEHGADVAEIGLIASGERQHQVT